MEEKMITGNKRRFLIVLPYLFLILSLGIVIAVPTFSSNWGFVTNLSEDQSPTFTYNFSANVTDSQGGTWTFSILGINSTLYSSSQSVSFYSWISLNSTTGVMTINSTKDNETGRFNMSIQVLDQSLFGESRAFDFIANATNDAPSFTNINTTYNTSQIIPLSTYVNASDEENHFPLFFNISFYTNCSLAAWSNRTNCNLFTFSNPTNTSALMNFSPTNFDAGIYWANVTVTDGANQSSCPHQYCINSSYMVNKTTSYSTVIFNVFSALDINVSDCQNRFFNESQYGTCAINITTKGATDSLNISTYSILRNYASGQAGVVNTSWFYSNNSTTGSSFYKTININVTPSKRELGNWTINFTVLDVTHNENLTAQINIFANRSTSLNDVPDLIQPSNLNTSINLGTVVNLSVYDDDTLIPDKNSSFGGFNETITFNRSVYNLTSGVELNLSNFTIAIVNMPVSGTNRTLAQLRFTANSSEVGSYKINITATDVDGTVDRETFNLTIINNNAPQWNAGINITPIYWEGNNTYLNLSMNVTDAENDALTFSYTNDTAFPSFSIVSSTGIINFTSNDSDVGYHIINITVSDGYLTNTTSFNFTIWNINDSLTIDSLIVAGASPDPLSSGGNLTVTEDNYTNFTLLIQDDDLRIPTIQINKGHYNESFSLNLTIQGVNTSLFSFALADRVFLPFANKSRYTTSFIPRKADVGNYNVTLNITDLSGNFALFTFNMTIGAIEHNPELSSLANQSSAVNRTLVYNLNVTDTENGNDTNPVGNTNFTFNYTFLSDGRVDMSFNSTTFNSTTGIINFTFNNTQAGKYHINFTVNDSASPNRQDFQDIWFFVYGLPNVTSPSVGTTFNLTENTTSILNFTVNHSVMDNLTYLFYVDSISSNGSYTYGPLILKNLTSYYGNGSISYNWSFTSNFSDETYGRVKNLTIIVYPNSSSLDNASLLNSSFNFKLNISHANYPISYDDAIDDKGPTAYGTDITINLANHFSDPDSSDYAYNQTPTFTASSNGSTITKSFSGWTLTMSSIAATVERMRINASDGSSSVVSENFTVTFTAPSAGSSSSSSSGGGGTTSVPVSLKIIMPDPVSAYQKDRIDLPITLHNTGSQTLFGINLSGETAKDGALTEDISVSFSNTSFPILEAGKKINLTMTLIINTEEMGLFEITVDANVKTPKYHDWGKLYLTIKEGESVREKLLFTEEFIVDNPECAELTELIEEADALAAIGDNEGALRKAEEALAACKDILEQASRPGLRQIVENKLYRYLAIASVVAFAGGIAFYSYKRMKLRRTRGTFVQEDIKNKKYLD